MSKKNKKIDNKEEKTNKVEEKVEMENYWDVFVRNYRNVPGFRSLVKLIIYSLLILLFIVIASSAKTDSSKAKKDSTDTSTTTTTKVSEVTSYQSMLDNILTNEKKLYIDIKADKDKYVIDGELNNGILIGYFTESKNTKRFSIEDGKIYESNLDEREENSELFGILDPIFIDQKAMIALIKKTAGTKEVKDQEIIYNYNITSREKEYVLKTYIKENNLYKIEVAGDNIFYDISYK